MLSSFDFNVHDQLAYTMTGDQICVWCWVLKKGTEIQMFLISGTSKIQHLVYSKVYAYDQLLRIA